MNELSLFNEEELKLAEEVNKNRYYYENMNKAVLGFFKYHGIELESIRAQYYEDADGCIIYNRFDHVIALTECEPDGIQLEFTSKGAWKTIPEWVYDLIDRIRWNRWPLGFDNNEEWDETQEWNEAHSIEHCWHHTGIMWNRHFGPEYTHWKIQIGFCYCS